jgi:hypothetical protein
MRKQIDLAKKSKSAPPPVTPVKRVPELPPPPPPKTSVPEVPAYEPQYSEPMLPEKRPARSLTPLFVVILLIVLGFIVYQFLSNR